MLTWIERTMGKMRREETCRCGEARGTLRVARVAVVVLMAFVFGMAGFVSSAEAAISQLDSFLGCTDHDLLSNQACSNWTVDTGVSWCTESAGTPSTGPGPAAGNPDPYLYHEASASSADVCQNGFALGDTVGVISNSLDAGANIITLDLEYNFNLNGSTDGCLHLDVNDGVWNNSVTDAGSGQTDPNDGNSPALFCGATGDTWTPVNVDLDALGYNTGNIQLRLRVVTGTGGTVWHYDYAFDNIQITGVDRDATPPTSSTVTVSPESSTFVPADFTTTTQFTDAQSAVTSCDYTTDGSSWSAGTVSGSGTYTCTANVTGATGSLTINMRGTSGGGTTTASSISRTVDVTAPSTTASPTGATFSSEPDVTLSASDGGSGVQQTLYCLDTTNSCSPAATYSGPVTITGTGGASVTKYLRFASSDNLNNTETIQSETYIIDLTCTPGVITIPGSQTVSGSSVDLTALYSNTGNIDGFTYKINAGAVTSPWNSTSFGTVTTEDVTLEVSGNDTDCSVVVTQSNTITVDNRPDDLTTQAASGSQSGLTAITVTMPYSGDKNGDATFQVDYKISTDSVWNDGTPQDDSDNTTPYVEPLTGLTADKTYDIRVTYFDPDGVSGANPQTFSVTLISWVDTPLLHNALRFACDIDGYSTQTTCEGAGGTWDIARKWTNGWGTDTVGAKYGPILCSTCHVRGSTNIKRVMSTIASPNSPTDDFPGSTVTFLDATADNADTATNPADFGDDSDGRGTTDSVRICEVCHSQTTYHRSTTDVIGNPGHYNKQDCIACHQHNQGFKASCAACHGNPPVDAATLVFNPPSGTGSTEAGAHNGHVLDLAGPQYTCSVCHGIPFGNGANHTGDGGGSVTIDFNAFGSTGNSIVGSYDGQSSVNTGAGYDGDNVGTPNNNLDCNNVYCHGGTIGGSTPKWSDASAPCGSCHGGNAANPPANPASGTSHATHAGNGGTNIYQASDIALACNKCHGSGPFTGVHVNGDVAWNTTSLDQDHQTASAPVYDTSSSGSTGALAPSDPYKTCNNLLCHWGAETPKWDGDPVGTSADCTTCHGGVTTGGTGAPDTGQHSEHVLASGEYISCDSCHGTSSQSGLHAGHIDGLLTLGGDLNATIHDEGTLTRQNGDANYANDDSCALACHQQADWGVDGFYDTQSWNSGTPTIDWSGGTCDPGTYAIEDLCIDCHSDAYSYNGRSGPTVVTGWDFGGASTPTGDHLKLTTGDSLEGDSTCTNLEEWKTRCLGCHTKHYDATAIKIDLPTTTYDNPATAGTDNINMQTQLGISYTGANHGGIYLKGTLGSNEADACWTCHDASSESVSEWGYNTDTTPGSWPETQIASRDDGSVRSHNYGWVFTDATSRDNNTTANRTNRWIANDGAGYFHRDGYSTDATLQRQINAVHSADVNVVPDTNNSSVSQGISGTGTIQVTTQETPGQIRCTYCHDVHDLDLNAGVVGATQGKPYLRGSWAGNLYAPDMPPIDGYSYPSTGGDTNRGNRQWWDDGGTIRIWNANDAVPRLYVSTSKNKGGYFIDQNGNWPTKDANFDTLAETAGLCTICHGTDVDNMDYYNNATTKMWRSDQANGHANSTLGGSGAGHTNARNIFDGKRGATNYIFMGFQDEITPTLAPKWGKFSRDSIIPKDTAPYNEFSQPGDSMAGTTDMPAYLSGWFGGTEGDKFSSIANFTAAVPQYATWYYGSTTATTTAAIGTDGSSGATNAHSFACSKCHSPHASSLPALLTTNCLDFKTSSWVGGTETAIRANATNAWVLRVQNNCHRNEGTTTGWHKLTTDQ